jgi:catechol 2,3-dioxygenase-like lactoylglutathione lyase family enzyme
MAVTVRDPFSVDRAILNREMGCDAVAQVFQNAIAAVWIRTGFRLAPPPESGTIEHMAVQKMEHVGIVVDDLTAATEFFVELGLVLQGEGSVEGRWVDRVVGLEGVRADIAFMQTPDGNGRLELTKFHSPSNQGDNPHPSANTPGIRHLAFAVEDIDAVVAGLRARGAELVGELERYEDSYRLCYVRGPEGIIIELAEQIG